VTEGTIPPFLDLVNALASMPRWCDGTSYCPRRGCRGRRPVRRANLVHPEASGVGPRGAGGGAGAAVIVPAKLALLRPATGRFARRAELADADQFHLDEGSSPLCCSRPAHPGASLRPGLPVRSRVLRRDADVIARTGARRMAGRTDLAAGIALAP